MVLCSEHTAYKPKAGFGRVDIQGNGGLLFCVHLLLADQLMKQTC